MDYDEYDDMSEEEFAKGVQKAADYLALMDSTLFFLYSQISKPKSRAGVWSWAFANKKISAIDFYGATVMLPIHTKEFGIKNPIPFVFKEKDKTR